MDGGHGGRLAQRLERSAHLKWWIVVVGSSPREQTSTAGSGVSLLGGYEGGDEGLALALIGHEDEGDVSQDEKSLHGREGKPSVAEGALTAVEDDNCGPVSCAGAAKQVKGRQLVLNLDS